MKQYHNALRAVISKGVYKRPARAGLVGSRSLFGHQFTVDLTKGFPLLTTKKMYHRGIVAELLWFLRGDTNIKYLLARRVNIWNEDAYNYYLKIMSGTTYPTYCFEEFIQKVKLGSTRLSPIDDGTRNLAFHVDPTYTLGDCGNQYGSQWRRWDYKNNTKLIDVYYSNNFDLGRFKNTNEFYVDQFAELIDGLRKNPESRRHIMTSINPSKSESLALYWCHALTQFNARPISVKKRRQMLLAVDRTDINKLFFLDTLNYSAYENEFKLNNPGKKVTVSNVCDYNKIPKYYLDCHMYQRSADLIVGVPFNIASYALLTHIVAKLVGMTPGNFIHSFGDLHIYDNHKEAAKVQLKRDYNTYPLCNLKIESNGFKDWTGVVDLDEFINSLEIENFVFENYNSYPAIKAKLNTGLK